MSEYLIFRLKSSGQRTVVGSFLVAATVALGIVGPTTALADDGLQAVPSVFVGTAPGCAPSPPGSRIVTSAWLGGMGLPDNGGPNNNTTAAARNDRRSGLLLSKNGLTTDCSAAGAEITGVKGITVYAGFHLGFDYRNGGHCGAGAPRFNVVVTPPSGPDTFHFVGGCSNDTASTAAPQDPAEWTRVRFDTTSTTANQAFPPIPVGSRINSIGITFDEGTDTANNDTQGVGLAVVDNIDINGTLITRGTGIADGINRDKNDGRKDKKDKDGDDDDKN